MKTYIVKEPFRLPHREIKRGDTVTADDFKEAHVPVGELIGDLLQSGHLVTCVSDLRRKKPRDLTMLELHRVRCDHTETAIKS